MTSRVDICFTKMSDEPQILRFIQEYWRSDHVFVNNPELMRWQHQSPDFPKEDLTFVIGRRVNADNSSEILALLGYMPFRRFDPNADGTELALAIWKVRDDAGAPGLGLQLLKTIQRKLSPSLICAIGISQVVGPIYKALGYTVDALSHIALFPILAPQGNTVAIGVPLSARRLIADDPDVDIQPIIGASLPLGVSVDDINNLAIANLPSKSWNYVLNRYSRHPQYEYEIRIVKVDGHLRAIIVWRQVYAPMGSILRIVDVIGDPSVLARCGAALRRELMAAQCEYMDLMHWGVSSDELVSGGFVNLADHDGLVLPNYFEPFEQRNVRIEIAFRVDPNCSHKKLFLYRADSDQDRPNQPNALYAKRGYNEL